MKIKMDLTMMNRYKNKLTIFLGIILMLTSCKETETTVYDGPSLVHFITPWGELSVRDNNPEMPISIGTTSAVEYDRHYSIEVVRAQTLDEAIEGREYEIVDDLVTIPAGEVLGEFTVRGLFEGVTEAGTYATFTIAPQEDDLADFDNEYTLELMKFCDFSHNAFMGQYDVEESSYFFGNNKSFLRTDAGSLDTTILVNNLWSYGAEAWEAYLEGMFQKSIDFEILPIEIHFDNELAICSIPKQAFIINENLEGDTMYIGSFYNPGFGADGIGEINSCFGSIEDLDYWFFSPDSMQVYDAVFKSNWELYTGAESGLASEMTNVFPSTLNLLESQLKSIKQQLIVE
ncbi:hypothetical protein [Carboxylicivirga sp. M1479]|uniref:hypothetical protein n=1 Tax=Carboxylicivirga sp. M1479 TaxID=2594476 RepID=UPI001177CE1D|nr:hypothetical protein [Carboxylicivirga sp. M1479]TRX72091.1 hypothetical protein FNN09_03555 [Carboxylicivirga sp. M1479]